MKTKSGFGKHYCANCGELFLKQYKCSRFCEKCKRATVDERLRQQELRRLSLLDTIKDKPKFQTAVDKTGRFIGFVTGVTREDREKKKPKGLQLYGAAFTHNGVHE